MPTDDERMGQWIREPSFFYFPRVLNAGVIGLGLLVLVFILFLLGSGLTA